MNRTGGRGARSGADLAADFGGFLGWLGIVALSAMQLLPAEQPDLSYPNARRVEQIDVYHGVAVADPWRWMENPGSAEVQAWILAQNQLAERYISALPARTHFAARLRALLDHERMGLPDREGDVYAWTWNPGQAEQDVLRVARDPAPVHHAADNHKVVPRPVRHYSPQKRAFLRAPFCRVPPSIVRPIFAEACSTKNDSVKCMLE